MGLDFDGKVLRAPRNAPGNDPNTSEPNNGVVRDVRVPPPGRAAAQPAIVDMAADQYRSALVNADGTTTDEFLVWAANSSQVARVADDSWWSDEGKGRIPKGNQVLSSLLPSGLPHTDGTLKVIVTDDGGRDIAQITHVVVARGDVTYEDYGWVSVENPTAGRRGSSPYLVIVPKTGEANPRAGVVTLTESNVYAGDLTTLVGLSSLDGGLSLERGDVVVEVRYTVSPQTFWWTRNDRYETRFGWDASVQRWRPFRGSAPVNLGPLEFDTSYKLTPKLRALPVGSILEGNASIGDQYAVVRLGSFPGASSVPVGINDPEGFSGIEVVADEVLASGFDFDASTAAAVVGQFSGELVFNPRYVQSHAGKVIWYSYGSFDADADGVVGNLLGADRKPLYLAPIPGPTDYPFIRINNRSPLVATTVATEADLPSSVDSGACYVARSTGRLLLSEEDVAKADPTDDRFSKHFLGAQVVYDGTALNAEPQPTKQPVPLVQADGVTDILHPYDPMYLPPAGVFPEDGGFGLGVSGVLFLPDGTGSVPNPEGVDPATVDVPVRPGGDTLPPVGGGVAPQSIGLVRRLEDGVGDTIVFSRRGAVENAIIVDRISDLPGLPFEVKGGSVYLSREGVSLGGVYHSQVQISAADRARFAGERVYFLQASMQPSYYTTEARIYSKRRIVFRFRTGDTLYFAVDGVSHDWSESLLDPQDFYSAAEVAESIQTRITAQGGTGVCRAEAGRVVLEAADPSLGSVEIGWGDPRDLSGATALGFMPGWKVTGGQANWLSDAGVSFGLGRSLVNLDRSLSTPDYRQRVRLEDTLLVGEVQPNPFVFLDFPPVEDIAGYDEGVFFNLQSVTVQGESLQIIDKRLHHFEDIQHRFGQKNIAWLNDQFTSDSVTTPLNTIPLGQAGVVPESLAGAPGMGGGLYVAQDGGRFVFQEQGVDYLLPFEGQPGVAQLVEKFGALVTFGARGSFLVGGTTFTDTDADFLTDSTDPDIDPATGLQRVDSNTGELIWLPLVRAGFRLKISTGASTGSYIVQSVTANTLEVSPAFPSSSLRATPYEVFSGIPADLYDPGLVADMSYRPFDHLPQEPFQIRVLSPLGLVSDEAVSFVANVEDANGQNRALALRFGAVVAPDAPQAQLTPLTWRELGTLANGSLVVPDDAWLLALAFRLEIGTEVVTDINPVYAFSSDPDGVECLLANWTDDAGGYHVRGELKFNSTLLADLENSKVFYVQELLPATSILPGEAQYDPKTGDVRISQVDAGDYSGVMLYFVEQMGTGGASEDAAVSPLVGSVTFSKPLNRGSLVEMTYWLADVEGRRVGEPSDTITEFLSVFVRRQPLTRLSSRMFQLDAAGEHLLDNRFEPTVYIGPVRQNYGVEDFRAEVRPGFNGLVLTFNRDIPAWVTPEATYSVFDAQGGERVYNTSQTPVYRPPFFIKAGVSSFGLRGNRVADFEPGQMLRVGSECFYITNLTYLVARDVTKMEIYPPTVVEVGSRSPGNDVLSLVTSDPITPSLFPDSDAPVATNAAPGFMSEVPVEDFPFEPVNANQNTITFRGDLTRFAVAGHIMEISGKPFTIETATLNEDGTRTKLSFTAPFREAVDPAGKPTVRLSYRPIYPPDTRVFLGVGALVDTEPLELTLFGETDDLGNELPGRQLAQNSEWALDPNSGVIQLLEPLQAALGPRQRLLLSYTRIRVLQPFYSGGRVALPRWAARFKYNTIPDDDNGFLGGRLTATYTFENPDSFYFRSVSLDAYLAEVLPDAIAVLENAQAGSGPRLTATPDQDNWDQGTLGIPAQRRDLLDKDRTARILISFFNDAVNFFEQIDETISGKFIGDRDGKFRFWVGRGREYAPPGYEDDITGELNPFHVFARAFNERDPTREILFLPDRDSLVEPDKAAMTDLRLTGEPLSVFTLRELQLRQKALIRNDLDDVVLLGVSRPRTVRTTSPPYFTVQTQGRFESLWEPSALSRIFPTTARVFFTLGPGLGSDLEGSGYGGVYAWRRTINGKSGSTWREQIGQIGNPVLGDISNITDRTLQRRLPRARIFGYYPDGLPASAFGVALEGPLVVLSQVPLSDLPMDPATGFPDYSRFLSQSVSGTVPDVEAGDPDLALAGLEVGQKVAWGQPDGSTYEGAFPEEVDVFGVPVFSGIFIHDIQFGCVVRFQDRRGNRITDPSQVLVAVEANAGTPAHLFGIGRADTLFVIPADVANPFTDPSTQAATVDNIKEAAANMPNYRIGFDVAVRRDGRVVDISLPSWDDPFLFPIQELLGQRPPTPLSHLEGDVDFANTDTYPLNIPALQGQALDDSGDNQIPYLKGSNTELDRFDEITNVIGPLMNQDAVLGGYYPDEILFNNGEVLDAAVAVVGGDFKEPATLNTETAQAVAGYGETPGRPGDFLLVEVDTGSPEGWQGILSVGRLRSGSPGGISRMWIEPPRFCTQAGQGSPMTYILDKYAVHLTPGGYPTDPEAGGGVAGVRIFGDVANDRLILSFQDVVFALNDADAINTGNLNTILSADPNNVVTIRLYSRPDDSAVNDLTGIANFVDAEKDGRELLVLELTAATITITPFKGAPTVYAHGGVTFGGFDAIGGEAVPGTVADHRHIIVTALGPGALDFYNPTVGSEAAWYLPHDRFDPAGPTDRRISKYGWEFSVSVDTTAGQSTSAYIEADRLTFHEVLDFRLARPRGYSNTGNPNGTYTYETGIQVTEVTLGTGLPSTCNDVTGGLLTFVSREGSTSSIEGSWNPAPSPAEEGSVRVMAFEDGNTPILATNITATVQASQTLNEATATDILSGEGTAQDEHILPTAVVGALSDVQKGDVVYISSSTDPVNTATEKAGTFITRHAVDGGGLGYREVPLTAYSGAGEGFLKSLFPRITRIDVGALELEVDDASLLPVNGRVFVLLRPNELNNSNPAIWATSIFSVSYTGVVGNILQLDALANWYYADGTVVPAPLTEITSDLVVGKQLGWHDNSDAANGEGVLEVSVRVRGGALPDDSSVVGLHNPGVDASYGFHRLTLDYGFGVVTRPAANIGVGAPLAGNVTVEARAVHANGTFDPTGDAAVYDNVPGTLRIYLDENTLGQGSTLYNPQGHPVAGAPSLAVVLPGVVAGVLFHAKEGLWLEPSTPQYPVPLGGVPKVVDASRSLVAVGMRSPATPESVNFEVRRVRRWHGIQNGINDAFGPLRYAYEIRRGIVTGFTRNEQQVGFLTASGFSMDWNVANPLKPLVPDVWNTGATNLQGTNLGAFDDVDVNIHPGDTVRLLDDDGRLVGEGVILEVLNGTVLKVAAPGIPEVASGSVVGLRFEIYLSQAPVPHEQSHEQLLALITQEVVYESLADRSDVDPQNWTGGYVPEADGVQGWLDVANKLYDDSSPGLDFTALGIQVGDIVVIDPAGTLPVVNERGNRPLGDRGVPTRTATDPGGAPAPTPYQAGSVSSLDDNRGFYRVLAIHEDHLEVDPVHEFGGSLGSDVIGAPLQTNLSYAMLPTVNSSVMSPDGAEGQNDLRPTRKAVGGTYTDTGDALNDKHSLRPFSYRIVRPTGMLSSEIVDTVLFLRERMLSLIEMFQGAMSGGRGGFYYDWQADEHVLVLGEALDPDSGVGVFPNRLIRTLVGEVDVSPFLNTSDCLSILDRRFWVRDLRLDFLEPDPGNQFAVQEVSGVVPFDRVGGPYTAYTDTSVTGGSQVRPVLMDHLALIQDVRDNLRGKRYAWLTYRVHRYLGTLSKIKAFDEALPQRLRERARALSLVQTMTRARS